ncbi:MAG TPA: aspartate-semialdehyde dehydrogenase [Solirubrobacteraceae bacterium]|nr:aspartate-semialdehyde dehydrogenase [Solirubrobacteraceae bacterium]
MSNGYRVAVVGATGQVGTLMLELLRARAFPASEIVAFASERSVGRVLEGAGVGGEDLVVEGLDEESIEGFDVALFSAGGATSGEWAPKFAKAGAVVIDNSSKWRMDEDVPLVVSEVNPDALAEHKGIVANPNCSTMQMVVALAPLHRAAGIERLVISTYQAVSGTGKRAVDELLDQSHALLLDETGMFAKGERLPASSQAIGTPEAYAHQIAFNALPHAGSFADGDDHTDEERKLIDETRKILGDQEIKVSATCVRVPVLNGHSEAVNVQLRDPLSPERARELLDTAPGVEVLDDPAQALYPLAIDASGKDEVFVGRIRRDPGNERALDLWIVADNLRKGAALNAVQLAELLHERGLIGTHARARSTPQREPSYRGRPVACRRASRPPAIRRADDSEHREKGWV